jgi:hypothetical protein
MTGLRPEGGIHQDGIERFVKASDV